MDRHNMLLFLQQDTSREKPVGFERSRRNIFDPEDDLVKVDSTSSGSNGGAVSDDLEIESIRSDNQFKTPINGSASIMRDTVGRTAPTTASATNASYGATDVDDASKSICARKGCHKRVRFDSLFCSDACGLSALEYDLLGAMQFGGDIHPSLLRG